MSTINLRSAVWCLSLLDLASGYWLMGANNVLTTQRMDPIVNSNAIGLHAHSVLGASNFGFSLSTESLRQSECTSVPVVEDKSNYWYPHLYFWWKNGTFTSLIGNPVIYYLYSDKPGETKAFPDDFRMVSGDPTLRTFDESSFAQRAITHLCLNMEGTSHRHNSLPPTPCPHGIRSEINFPSCWDGKNYDSADHRSHMAFRASGPDSGECTDPAYPVTVPRIFLEVYWETKPFDELRREAMDPDQPFVFANGDPTGYGYHGDFYNGWLPGALQKAIDDCNCDPYGAPECCADRGAFTLDRSKKCFITNAIDEPTLGTLLTLPGNNPVQSTCYEQYLDSSIPPILSPVHVHNGTLAPTATATVSAPSKTLDVVQTARGKCLWGVASGLPDAGDDGDDTSTDQTPDEKKPSASMKLDGTPLFVCFIVSWVVVLASLIGF